MPAVSQAQQKLMGMAYALKKGEMKKSEASKEVQDLADNMSLQQLKDFAETKHKGLPKHVEESGLTGFLSAGPLARYSTYPANISAAWAAVQRDRKDPLIQTFLDFITKKEEKEKANEAIAAMVPPGVAQPSNTPGMGNATPPAHGNVGSGDKFGEEDDEDDINMRIGIMSFDDYKKWIKKWQEQKSRK
jgi:hypothetical protein